MSTQLGVVYVFELSNGRVKVGRTQNIQKRMTQHESIARLYANEKIVKSWHSMKHYNFKDNERLLIQFFGGYSEWTGNVKFDSVVEYAKGLAYKTTLSQEEIDEEERKNDSLKNILFTECKCRSSFESKILKHYEGDIKVLEEWRKSYQRAVELTALLHPSLFFRFTKDIEIDVKAFSFILAYVDFRGDEVFEGIPIHSKSYFSEIIDNGHRRELLLLADFVNKNDTKSIENYMSNTIEDFLAIGKDGILLTEH